jgi:acetyl-CoA carboxylase biotin carboxyl carrier protein
MPTANLSPTDLNFEIAVELKDIKAIIDLMRKNSIAEFELEREGFKIRLKRGGNGGVQLVAGEEAAAVLPLVPAPQILPPAAAGQGPVTTASLDQDIKSPMIGTFYRSPSPEASPYVDVGTQVTPDTVVCIIEAMKVMNEIKAEARGVITKILAENGKPVEFGQPLFKIRPN